MTLFEPDRHEGLAAPRWDEAAARRAIGAIVRDTEERFSLRELWPAHPLNYEGAPPSEPYTGLHVGAAGVIFALDVLARHGLAETTARFATTVSELGERNRREMEGSGCNWESYLDGRSGLLLTRYRVAPSHEVADELAEAIAANTHHPTLELMWGAAGTMHAALEMHESTGEERWADLYRAGARVLAASLEHRVDCSLWVQEVWGRRLAMLGAAHGYAGNAGAIVRGLALLPRAERSAWIERIVQTTLATARREAGFANWPDLVGPGRRPFLLQWCHGAPGFITSLALLADHRLDETLLAAGELVWMAGPLRKGPGLCHGTAGNGYAFLKLFERTGYTRWLERARAFAMHAIAQSEAHAARYGMRRYSLYTGDPGLAIYLLRCIDGATGWPGLDPEQ